MDVAQRVGDAEEVWSTAVRLRPDWKRRLLIIVAVMVAVCVGSVGWVVLAGGESAIPQTPDSIAIVVVGALDPYADPGLGPARAVMAGPKVADMLSRLQRMRAHLMLVHTYYQMQAELPVVGVSGESATATSLVYDAVETAAHDGDVYHSDAYTWTFQTVRQSFPQPGWFLTDFTAPDECQVYVKCVPVAPAPVPAPSASGAAYPPVYVSCARADALGVVDAVVTYAINVGPDGVADFSQAWSSVNVSCTTDPLHAAPVVSSPVERAAVAATGGVVSIGVLYADCAARFDLGLIAGPGGGLGGRVGEFRGALVLCPNHPDARAIRAAIDGG